MAYEAITQIITLEAGANLSAKQYFFTTVAADGQVDPTGDGLMATGVLQNNPDAAGKAAALCVLGVTKVSAGGTITAGNAVASDASGEAVVAATGDIILGTALESGVDGDIIPVLFNPRGAAA